MKVKAKKKQAKTSKNSTDIIITNESIDFLVNGKVVARLKNNNFTPLKSVIDIENLESEVYKECY